MGCSEYRYEANNARSVVYFESGAATWNFYDSGHVPLKEQVRCLLHARSL
jgi:hypothetical protein